MPRFFTAEISDGKAVITGDDARHISKSLRMKKGESLTVCDLDSNDYHCAILEVKDDIVVAGILEKLPCISEPGVKISLYQALPKAGKLELIAQKAVELGVYEITPVVTSRCVSHWTDSEKKTARLQKIMAEAAKQSGRGIIPQISPLCGFEAAIDKMRASELAIMFYEGEKTPLREILIRGISGVSIMVGGEGGFSSEEAEAAKKSGVLTASLGSRILRCETASICAISAISFFLGEF